MKKYLEARIELIIISLVLIVSIFAFSLLNGSTAWFASNEEVSSNNLSLTISSTPNLIISDNIKDIREGKVKFNVGLDGGISRENMIAVTRDPAKNANDPHLVYITNHYYVDSLGLGDPEKLGFTPVPEEDNEAYFIEKTIYLSTVGGSISVKALNATLSASLTPQNKDEGDSTTPSFINATAIDLYYYVCDKTQDACKNCSDEKCSNDTWQWCGTTWVADSVGGNGLDILNNAEIPKNTDGYIAILMRIYFDGAKTYKGTKTVTNSNGVTTSQEVDIAYITTNSVKIGDVTVDVQFSAIEN